MKEDTLKLVGKKLPEDAKRDAIHIAVAPMIAGEDLGPGDRVQIVNGRAYGSLRHSMIGVVDPFLGRDLKEGDRFFLFLTPGTITSLRHEWEHPVLDNLSIYDEDELNDPCCPSDDDDGCPC